MDNEENEDSYKPEGRIQLKIDNFNEFAQGDMENPYRFSDDDFVLGLPWEIYAEIVEDELPGSNDANGNGGARGLGGNDGEWARKQLVFSLTSDYHLGSRVESWACAISGTFKLLAQKEGKQDRVYELDHLFKSNGEELKQSMPLEEVMDRENGWYDEINDCIVLSADFTAQALHGFSFIRRPDMLLVNGVEVEINKHILAANSDYFKSFFFGEGYKENSEIVLEPPATVELFKRTLDAMEPDAKPLDDNCIEGVYHLANRFLLADVEQKCRFFLLKSSKHSTMFKYRLADKYGFKLLKNRILADSKKEMANVYQQHFKEYAKLDEKARQALDSRFGQD